MPRVTESLLSSGWTLRMCDNVELCGHKLFLLRDFSAATTQWMPSSCLRKLDLPNDVNAGLVYLRAIKEIRVLFLYIFFLEHD